ncbi:MAG: efflux RND transporter periplasmic adaptor subunit [Gammaproteobacteria bacterium]|nr:MAG: efflux RND transporter periplasmic adaptor subunit [Gammaproteobacteria bacterium]
MKKTYLAALVVALLFVLWMLSGQIGTDGERAPAPSLAESRDSMLRQREDSPMAVRVRNLDAELQRALIAVRGRTEVNRRVAVRAETGGLVAALPVEKGDVVRAGDILCRIDAGSRPARLEESREAVTVAELEFEGVQKLEQRGLVSATGVATARARLATARADLRQRELDLSYTAIRAPFDGIVETRPVEIGDFLQAGQVCAEVLDPDPLLLAGQVSERDVARLQIGDPGTGRLLTGERVSGVITYVAQAAHPSTRTFRVEVAVPNPNASLRDGITTEIQLPAEEHLAHHVPSSVLALDDLGELGVRIVDADDRVQFVRIRVIRDTADGLWVTGLPETVRLITVGQELVVPGEQVRAVPEAERPLPIDMSETPTRLDATAATRSGGDDGAGQP